jgi:tetratricopeptide (TPR) repeat protein/predicted small lipoprotein YifL
MRQVHAFVCLSLLALVSLCGCGRQAPSTTPPATKAGEAGESQPAPLVQIAPAVPGQTVAKNSPAANDAPEWQTTEEQYEAALADALTQLADQKWPQALEAFEAARRFNDSDFVKGEIAKLKLRIDQEAAAEKTVRDIETILDEGKPGDAAKLAQDALREYGGGSVSPQLVKLRLQADALQLASAQESAENRYDRYRAEGEAALKEQNLRAAALALEQAVQARQDARVKQQLDDVRLRLTKYDDQRRRAAELRRDPVQLEEAIACLNDAAEAWDTLQVRQEIDEYNLALQRRRDNVSVAAFETQGEVGFADAGRIVAEELLPHFKARFDLVERAQIGKVIQELKLEESFIDDAAQQQELARLAKVRYLVVGSVRRIGGVTVNARLVDARTGLVVQTGKVVAPTVEDAVGLLPELAKQLMMSDDEKLAYDQQQMQLAKRVEPVGVDEPLPPPPPAAPVQGQPLPPPVVFEAPPPAFTGVTVEHFQRLPPPPVVGVRIAPPPPPPPAFQQRMLHVALQLGDNAFRLGLHRDANRHFDFALGLAPGNFDVRLRLERTARFLPPPPPTVVIVDPVLRPAPVLIAKPRVVLLDFATFGDPLRVPPHLGYWTAQRIAPYLRARYDIVDPAEAYWYMSRLGMTMRDIMDDPHARRWLGHALGARYFILGTVVQTASFDVSTYVLDAEFGHLHSSAKIHVQNRQELRLRIGELAWLTTCDPVERNRYLAGADQFNGLIVQGRRHFDRREFSLAIGVFENALRLRPGHVELMVHLTNARRQAELLAFEEARRQAFLRQQVLAAEAARRQMELARAAELARMRAVQQAALRAEADRRAYEQQRLLAHQQLVSRARIAIQTENFSLALDFFKGAADLVPAQPVVAGFTPQPDLLREMALTRSRADKSAQVRAAQQTAAREAALRVQREKELALAKQKLLLERQKEAAVEAAQRKAQEERDRLLYQSAFDDGQQFMAQKNYAAALSSFQAARRVKSTPAVEQLIALAMREQTLAKAGDDKERKQIEQKLAEERQRRQQAETEAKQNRALYESALAMADKALTQKQYAVAETKYQEAARLFQTDEVRTGLRRVQSVRAAELQQQQAGQDKERRVKQLLDDGRSAFQAKQYGKAIDAYRAAKKIEPDNLDVLAGLTQAEQAEEKFGAAARRKVEEAERQQNFARLLKSGHENVKAKQYDAAVATLNAALKLKPGDPAARAALDAAQDGHKKLAATKAADAKAEAAAKQKTEAYQKLLTDGRLALQAKRYDDAIGSFAQAQKLLPGDKTSADFLKDARDAKAESEAAVAAAAKKRADELQRAAELQKSLTAGRTAMASKDFAAAAKALTRAAQLAPENPDVQRALKGLQQAQDQARKEATLDQERSAKVKDYLATAQTALKKNDLNTAARALTQADKLDPRNPAVDRLLRDLAEARKTAQQDDERNSQFAVAVSAGQKALQAKRYDDAVKSLQEATRLRPGDAQAQRLLQQAKLALKEAAPKQAPPKDKTPDKATPDKTSPGKTTPGKTTPTDAKPLPVKPMTGDAADRKTFLLLVQTGQKAMKDKMYDDAVKAFRQAAKLMPDDQQAARLLKQAIQLRDEQTPDRKKKTGAAAPVAPPASGGFVSFHASTDTPSRIVPGQFRDARESVCRERWRASLETTNSSSCHATGYGAARPT